MSSLWQRLIEPAASVTDPERRRQSRTLLALLLGFVPITAAAIVIPYVLTPNAFAPNAHPLYVFLGLLATLAGGWLVRSGRYMAGVLVVVATASLVVFALALADTDGIPDVNNLYTMIAAVLIASTFLPLRYAVGVTVGNVALTLLYIPLHPSLRWQDVVFSVLAFQVAVAALILISARQRRRLENERQTEMRQSETRYRLLAENATDIITTVSPDGTVLYVSPAIETLLGYAPAVVLGQAVVDFIHPDDLESVRGLYRDLNTSRAAQTNAYRFRNQRGEYVWMESTSRGVFSGEGKLERVIAVLRDITKRKDAETALRESEARARAVIEQAADGIFITDRYGVLLDVNTKGCKMLGYERADLLGLRLSDVVTTDTTLIERPSKNTLLSERRALRKDGSSLPVEMNARPLPDGRLLAIVRDVSERKQAEAQRMELTIEKERVEVLQRFIGDASHDLRTPLSVMKNSLYLLKRTLPADALAQGKNHIELLDTQVGRIDGMLKDLLTMSRLDRAEPDEFSFDACDLNDLVEGAADEFRKLAEGKKQIYALSKHPGALPIKADGAELPRAIGNLVKNAIMYTSEGGEVRVSTYVQDGQAVIEVRDNGIGISALDLPHIFERFYKVDRSRRKASGAGMGLGLAIARRIVQAHGGRVTVDSAPGIGSTFRVILPLNSEKENA